MTEVIKVEDCGRDIRDYDIPIHNAIIVPNNATNGDVIKAMFPDYKQKAHINNGYFEMYFNNDIRDASYMRVSKEFWNAPYKREVEEDGKSD